MPKYLHTKAETPDSLRPYIFNGIDLTWKDKDKNAIGECPFCGRADKFSVLKETGQFNCLVCGEHGNASSFLSILFPTFDETPDYAKLVTERGLLSTEVLQQWQVLKHPFVDCWCIPGFNEKGKLTQVYQYRNTADGKRLLPTPTLGHQLFGVSLFDVSQTTTYLCEGPWDGMALWEILRGTGSLENVVAVPGCNVFKEKWALLFAGQDVKILFDNDCPRKHPKSNKKIDPPGYTGALRTAQILSEGKKTPNSIEILTWGEDGYNQQYRSGYDVRDALQSFGPG